MANLHWSGSLPVIGAVWAICSLAIRSAADSACQRFAQLDDAMWRNVSCVNEVIWAAGESFSSPLLQVYDTSPESILRSLKMDTRLDLPGVEANLS